MRKIILFLFLLVCVTSVYGGEPGTSTAPYLKIVPDAKSLALGSTGVSLADDMNSAFHNPAGLAYVNNFQIGASYIISAFDSKYQYIAFAYNLKKILTLGLNFRLFDFGLGDQPGYDANGNQLNSSVSASAWAGSVSVARKIIPKLSAGLNLGLVHQKLVDTAKNAVSFDFGSLYELNKNIKAGLSLQNIGSKLDYSGSADSLPLNIKLGLAYNYVFAKPFLIGRKNELKIPVEVNIPSDNKLNFHFGTELYLTKISPEIDTAIRFGVKYPEEGSFLSYLSFGFGIMYRDFGIDFGYNNRGDDIGNEIRISACWKMGYFQPLPEVKKEEVIIEEESKETTEVKKEDKEKKLEDLKKKLEELKKLKEELK